MSQIVYGAMEVTTGIVFARTTRACYEIKKKINNAKVGVIDFWDFSSPRKILKVITVNLSSCKLVVDQLEHIPVDRFLIDGPLPEYEDEDLDYIFFCDNPDGFFELLKMNK